MAIKISSLMKDKVRAKVSTMVGEVEHFITVFNPTVEQKIKFIENLDKEVDKLVNKGEDVILSAEEVVKTYYKELTDLDISDDEDILAILANPKPELIEVNKHINEIIHEIIMEIMAKKKAQLNKLKEMKVQGEVLRDTKKFLDEVGLTKEELAKVNIDLDENKIKIAKKEDK